MSLVLLSGSSGDREKERVVLSLDGFGEIPQQCHKLPFQGDLEKEGGVLLWVLQ